MNFLAATREAWVKAKQSDRICYVRRSLPQEYITTFEYHNDWLFRVYPGGRRELSIEGNKIYRSLKEVFRSLKI